MEAPPPKIARPSPRAPPAGSFFKHHVSCLIHFCDVAKFGDPSKPKVFACGKRVTAKFSAADNLVKLGMCRLCKVHAATAGFV